MRIRVPRCETIQYCPPRSHDAVQPQTLSPSQVAFAVADSTVLWPRHAVLFMYDLHLRRDSIHSHYSLSPKTLHTDPTGHLLHPETVATKSPTYNARRSPLDHQSSVPITSLRENVEVMTTTGILSLWMKDAKKKP